MKRETPPPLAAWLAVAVVCFMLTYALIRLALYLLT